MSKLIKGLGLAFVLFAGLEFGIRYSGFGDFPIYNTDDQIGYVPAPAQSGALLRVNDWSLNERSMLSDRSFVSDSKSAILLIGDSIVWGWLKYPQVNKLGPQLGLKLGQSERVWSVGAPSWSVLNELTWIGRNQDVVSGVRDIIWIVNSGDLSPRSLWTSDSTHPKEHPVWLTGYLVRKFLAVKGWWPTSDLPIQKIGDVDADLALLEFCQAAQRSGGPRIHFVFYPNVDELSRGPNTFIPFVDKLERLSKQAGAGFYDLRTNTGWSPRYYRDGMHPTPEGNEVLASIIAKLISETPGKF